MTVSSQTSRVSYAGNGSTTAFAVSFYFLADSHLKVILRAADGSETVKTLTTDYTVSGAGNPSGGTVTMLAAPASGTTLVIVRNVPLTQETDYQANDDFPAESHERALDKLTMEVQQLQEQVDRSAKLPVTNPTDADALVADIVRLADSADNIDTVATNVADVNTVAADLNEPVSEINTVAVNIDNVNTVGNNIANVNAVAGNNTNVTTVATNIASVNSAATNMAAIIAAPSEASAAAASAAAAAASAASGMYSAVQDKSADYTVVVGDAGDLIRMTTSGGARTVTLPAISTVPDGFNVTVVKWTGDTNNVTVTRSGSDTINGSTSYVLDAQYKSATFVADAQSSTWFASGSGSSSTNIIVDAFNGTGSQTAFTLSGDPGTENNTQVFVGGVYQEKDTYSVSGTTLTFSAAPPSGTNNIEVVWSTPLAIGTPSDGTVTTAKIADANVTAAKLASGAAALNIGYPPANDTAVMHLAGAETATGAKRGTITTDNDLSFDMNATNNFTGTPTGNGTLTFTNVTAGQSGFILLVNSGGYAISAHANTKVGASTLSTISAAGTYLLSYFSNGTNVYVTASGALS